MYIKTSTTTAVHVYFCWLKMRPTAINDSGCWGFRQSWDPNLFLSAAFTPGLGMDFFWRKFRSCWMQNVLLFQQNDQWQDGTIQITTSSSICKKPNTKPKSNTSTPICTTHSRSVGAWTAMFSEALHMKPSWELRQSIWLTFIVICLNQKISAFILLYHIRWFYSFTLLLLFHTFPTNHCKSCHNALAPWPWCLTCNSMQRMPTCPNCKASRNLNSPLFPVAMAGQFFASRWN